MKSSIKELLDSKKLWTCLIFIPFIFLLILVLGVFVIALTGNDILCYIGGIGAASSIIVNIVIFIISELIVD